MDLLNWFIENNKGLNYYLPDKYKDESEDFKKAYLKEVQDRMRNGLTFAQQQGALQNIPNIWDYQNFDPHGDNDPITTSADKGYYDSWNNLMGINAMNLPSEFVKTLTHENVHAMGKPLALTEDTTSFWEGTPLREKKSLVDRYNLWTKDSLGYRGSPYTILSQRYPTEDMKYNFALEEILADNIGRDGGPSQMKKPDLWSEKDWERMKDYYRFKHKSTW